MQGGNGIADVIFGDVNPAGRASVTSYVANADLPPMGDMDLYPNATAGSNGITYRYFKGPVQFPFGFGLSYTTFQYSDLSAPATAKPCDNITVTVKVGLLGDEWG